MSGPGTPDAASVPAAAPPPGLAAALVAELAARGWTVSVAESLTGGAVAASLVDVPGASRVLRGGVVPYATDLKGTLLGVDRALLARVGAVDPGVAEGMASGVRRLLGADVGIATTGVAGPTGQDGHPPGEVYVAVVTADGVHVERLELAGDRAAVREATCRAALACALDMVRKGTEPSVGRGGPAGNTGGTGHVG